jgi:hypothetical protein
VREGVPEKATCVHPTLGGTIFVGVFRRDDAVPSSLGMKRHPALIPLSRDHGLVHAVQLRRAAADGDASARLNSPLTAISSAATASAVSYTSTTEPQPE